MYAIIVIGFVVLCVAVAKNGLPDLKDSFERTRHSKQVVKRAQERENPRP